MQNNNASCVPGGECAVVFLPALVLSLEVVEKHVFACVGQLVVCNGQATVDHRRLPLPVDVRGTFWYKRCAICECVRNDMSVKDYSTAYLSLRLHSCEASEGET